MATTNFSGPITAGQIRNTTGTTLGQDIKNIGQVIMSQSVKVDITGASHLNQVCAVIPANSQIVDVILNVTTANDDTTASTASVGTVADADAFINAQSVQALATTHGTLDTEATNVGTTDIQVLADFTATDGDGTAGVGTVTVLYMQNNSIQDAVDL
jgi:hypothetical protein